jgi:hypothetical protein
MKTIIKIAIVLVVLFACFNVGRALLTEYQFEDAVHENLLFDPRMTDPEIVRMVLETAGKYNVPIDTSGISVTQQGPDIHIDMSYVTTIVLIPGVFEKEWNFQPSASTRLLVGTRRKIQ